MGWEIKRKEVDSIFPLNGCLCFDNRMGCFVGAITVTFTSLIAFVLVLLDCAEWIFKPNFVIENGYPAAWRQTFWKGFVLCDIAMVIAHPIMFVISVIVSVSILKPAKIYVLHPRVRSWCIIMVMYLITEVGVSVYIYSWYGLQAWRRAYLVFTCMFYLCRFVSNVSFLVVGYSYKCEIFQELHVSSDPLPEEFDYMSGTSNRKAPSQIRSASYLSPVNTNPSV